MLVPVKSVFFYSYFTLQFLHLQFIYDDQFATFRAQGFLLKAFASLPASSYVSTQSKRINHFKPRWSC